MKPTNRTTQTIRRALFVGLLLALGLSPMAGAKEFCDAGPHFVDGCSSGSNYVEGTLEIGIDLDLDGEADFDGTFVGYVHLVRSDPQDKSNNFPGLRPADGHTGVIDLEMPSMRSTGVAGTPSAGWTIRTGTLSGVAQPTFGAVAECEPGASDCQAHPSDPAWAYSVFSMFFEIDVPNLGTLRNYNPQLPNDNAFRIGTELPTAPPPLGTRFTPARASTPLFSGNGVHVANLVRVLSNSSTTASSRHTKNLTASLRPNGTRGDNQVALIYTAATGEVELQVPKGLAVNSISIDSASGIFVGEPAKNLADNADNHHSRYNIIKSVADKSFGDLSLGKVALKGLEEATLLEDLRAVGSLAGGAGAFGDLALIYVAE